MMMMMMMMVMMMVSNKLTQHTMIPEKDEFCSPQ
jgi:hypothetical protein